MKRNHHLIAVAALLAALTMNLNNAIAEADCGALENPVEYQSCRAAEAERALDEARVQVIELERRLVASSSSDGDVARLDREKSELEGEIRSLRARIDTLERAVREKDRQIAEQGRQIRSLSGDLDRAIAALDSAAETRSSERDGSTITSDSTHTPTSPIEVAPDPNVVYKTTFVNAHLTVPDVARFLGMTWRECQAEGYCRTVENLLGYTAAYRIDGYMYVWAEGEDVKVIDGNGDGHEMYSPMGRVLTQQWVVLEPGDTVSFVRMDAGYEPSIRTRSATRHPAGHWQINGGITCKFEGSSDIYVVDYVFNQRNPGECTGAGWPSS